jgi:hypothetical protein
MAGRRCEVEGLGEAHGAETQISQLAQCQHRAVNPTDAN